MELLHKPSADSGRIGNRCSSSRLPRATGCRVLVRWSRISARRWNAADPRSIPLLPHYAVIRAVCLSRPRGSSEEGCLVNSAVTAQHATAAVIGAAGTWILTDRCGEHDYCSSLRAATFTWLTVKVKCCNITDFIYKYFSFKFREEIPQTLMTR